MNENIDLTKILKDCPKGWKFYSSVCGEVEFEKIKKESEYPIVLITKHDNNCNTKSDGRYYGEYNDGECILFPSKEQRDWSKFEAPWYKKDRFDPKTLKPFDKVIVKDYSDDGWKVDFYSHKDTSMTYHYRCIGETYRCCIPYNDDTKHLVGTNDKAPDYYRYWED